MEVSVYRLWGIWALLMLLLCLVCSMGCLKEEPALRVWVINSGDLPITSVYMCSDPRDESWGPDLLQFPIGTNGMGLVMANLPKGKMRWVWPHIDGHGLMALAIQPGDSDVFIVVRRTDAGDYRAEVLSPSRAYASARFLVE